MILWAFFVSGVENIYAYSTSEKNEIGLYASPCESRVAQKIYLEFEHFYGQPNPWPEVQREKMSFAFFSPDTHILYIYAKETLNSNLGKLTNLTVCRKNFYSYSGDLSIFSNKTGLISDPHPLFDIFDRDFLYLTNLDFSPDLSEIQKDFLLKWYITHALHEQFHLHTVGMSYEQTVNKAKVSVSLFKEMARNTSTNIMSFSECSNPNGLYMKALAQDFSELRKLDDIWTFSSATSEVIKVAKQIVKNRNFLKQTAYASCLDDLRSMERIEGTATYFPVEARIMTDLEFAPNPLDIDNTETFSPDGNGPWYITGARLCKLASLLSPQPHIWQDAVRNGQPIDVVIEYLLNTYHN